MVLWSPFLLAHSNKVIVSLLDFIPVLPCAFWRSDDLFGSHKQYSADYSWTIALQCSNRLQSLCRIAGRCYAVTWLPPLQSSHAESPSMLSWHIRCWTFRLQSHPPETLDVSSPPSSSLNWTARASKITPLMGTLSSHLYKHSSTSVCSQPSLLT
jgi:hypothetical protein